MIKLTLRRALCLVLPAVLLAVRPATALMGGPVMPEYVQFEPSDAPDVVNLNTGDFSYTLPVGEVPGPYGNFPMTMSYHAGIGPGQEATWVGLGWTLNPGAINRTLRGTPDDQFHGGDLAFIYAYSVTHTFSVGITLSYGPIGLNMSYNSYSGYGLTASVSIQYGPYNLGGSFGTSGIGVNGGLGANGLGINGSLTFGESGMNASVGVGYTGPAGVTIGVSVGVSYEYGGKVAANSGFSAGYKSPDGSTIGIGVSSDGSVSLSAGKAGIGANVNLSSRGYSVGVSVGGTGLAVSTASSSSSHSRSNTASIVVPGLFDYSRSVYESWTRQATSEHTYGYMYQGGPALLVDGESQDFVPAGGGTGAATGDWDWKFKGRSLDHVGDPMRGHILPGYDMFNVASQGVSGAFRPMPLSHHRIVMSVEPIGTQEKDPDNDDVELDESPNALFYLLGEDANSNPMLRRQMQDDFTTTGSPEDPVPGAYTRNAYDYCWDDDASDALNVRYLQGDGSADRADKLNRVKSGECSRYAFFKSNHLNEGNRLLYSRNQGNNLDFAKNYRSRMVFTFLGENGGYFQGEPGLSDAAAKRGRSELAAALMKKTVRGWDDWPGYSSMDWDYPAFGARRIEPVLEDDSNIGRLKGFKITNPDGTQYFFTQPVRTLMSASYTTNQPTGGPAFIDRVDPQADENFLDLFREAWGNFVDNPLGSLADVGKWAGKLVSGSISSFLFYSPDFKTACDADDLTKTMNYSYMMSTNPYATQWLLTEIRGPDFVEFSQDDLSANFGYQVKLSYTKPVPYTWRTPYAPPGMSNDEVPNLRIPKNGQTPEDCLSELYHASLGVKELVYLKSVETATHKAEFVLNDPLYEERLDGKGWIFRWKGDYQNENGNSTTEKGIPILVGTHFPLERVITSQTASSKKAYLYRIEHGDEDDDGDEEYTYPKVSELNWKTRPVDYRIDGVYLDIQPTAEQIEKMVGQNVLVTGMWEGWTHPALKEKHEAAKLSPFPGVPESGYILSTQNSSDPDNRPGDATDPRVGFTLPAAPAVTNTNPAKAFRATVAEIRRSRGSELEFGAYKIVFTAPVVIPGGTLSYDFSLDNESGESGSWSTYFSSYTADPDLAMAGLNVETSAIVKIASGGGDFKAKQVVPLLVFNDFVDFSDWRGLAGERPNEMRYLKRIDIADKNTPDRPDRRFEFEYDNSIHPKTLNAYRLDPTSSLSLVQRHEGGYPTSPTGEDNGNRALQGKLKLASVREVACGGVDCSENLSLPPFRFGYWFEEQSSFQPGDNLAETIQFSSDVQDEWGFWNKHAADGNNKTHQYFADYGGMAWSMKQITDPSGGVMEVNYERDTYLGESYAEDDLAIPMTWGPCPAPHADKVCFEFVPRKWVKYCDRNDRLQGEWQFFPVGEGGSFKYLSDMGFVDGSELFYNVQQRVKTKVGCGLNIGFWKSGGCTRHRSVSLVGSAPIALVSLEGNKEPIFDQVAYETAVAEDPDIADNPPQCVPEGVPNGQPGNCCPAEKAPPPDHPDFDPTADYDPENWDYKNKFWVCNTEITRIRTEMDWARTHDQIGKTADKLRKRSWKLSGQRYGVTWSRQPNRVLKGGDLRVKELVKRDIGVVQRTRYEYAPGELAQYPDSAFSMAFATRFSTGKITDLMGEDLPAEMPEADKAAFRRKFRNLPPKSRVFGIGDEDAMLLPGASISYPKITMYNVAVTGTEEGPANGRTVFEYHTPEQRGTLNFVVRLEAPLGPGEDRMRDLHVEFRDGSGSGGNKTFSMQRLQVQTDEEGHFYAGSVQDLAPYRVLDLRRIKFYYGNPATGTGQEFLINNDDMDPGIRQPHPILEMKYAGTATTGGSLDLDEEADTRRTFDFPHPILESTLQGGKVVLEDRTSRIGKTKSITYYRKHKTTGEEILIKRDSMVYADEAPSVDSRFLGSSAQANKLGKFEEEWRYERKIKCLNSPTTGVPDCDSKKNKLGWEPYTKIPAEKRDQTVVHRRYPTFLTESWSITGFNGSTPPEDLPPGSTSTDYMVTHVTNHRFDPILGKPTLTVSYTGRTKASPAKATRMTPAYVVDPAQQTTDLPNLLFVKNVVEPMFREDVFTWDKATTADNQSGTPLNFNTVNLGGTNGANGGEIASRLTANKIMPMAQAFYNHGNPTDIRNPIVPLGNFTPRFNLVTASSRLADNAALLSASPSLADWAGNTITRMNRFLKATETQDAYGNPVTSRFEPRGFHQVGLFAPAFYRETAVLTPEGFPQGFASGIPDQWEWSGTVNPQIVDGFVSLTSASTLQHNVDIGGTVAPDRRDYVVEMQVWANGEIPVEVGFEEGSGTPVAQEIVPLQLGLQTKRLIMNAFTGSALPPGTCRFFFRNPDMAGNIRIKYLRVYPVQAHAKTYVYDDRGNMVQSVDEANLSTYYEYDLLGKLITIRNDDGVAFSSQKQVMTNR
jgi:YD repeat-containing protein